MRYQVEVGEDLAQAIVAEYGPDRTAEGVASELDFWTDPVAAARLAFQGFDDLPVDTHPDVRTVVVFSRLFGPVAFVGVRTEAGVVELADYAADPDYSELIESDPDE